jgi:hypothetical protein
LEQPTAVMKIIAAAQDRLNLGKYMIYQVWL